MRAILLGPVVGSSREEKELFLALKIRPSDLLVGVDGGVNVWLRWGYTPDFAVGDWDSIQEKKRVLAKIPHLTLSKDKNRSDLFYAAVASVEAGAQELLCVGVTGERPDHQLAMIYDLSNLAGGRYGELKSVEAIGKEGRYFFLSEEIRQKKLSVPLGTTISLFAIGDAAQGVFLNGFHYPLKNSTLTPCSLGLSNLSIRRNCEVRLRKGRLLVILLRNGS